MLLTMPFKFTFFKLQSGNRNHSICQIYHSLFCSVAETCEFKELNYAVKFLHRMHQHGASVSRDDLYLFVQRCNAEKNLVAARLVHSLIISSKMDSITVFGDHLIRMFNSCGDSLLDAVLVFQNVSNPSVYTWNAIISTHVMFEEYEMAFQSYYLMQEERIVPVNVTFLLMLKACGSKQDLVLGRLIHSQFLTMNIQPDAALGTAIIAMYGKCGNIEDSQKIFDMVPSRDEIMYSTLISVYTEKGSILTVLKIFERMLQEHIEPTNIIYASVLKSCIGVDSISHGMLIHNFVIDHGFGLDVVVGNSLIEVYVKFGALQEAYSIFGSLSNANMVTWSLLISGHVQHGLNYEALELFVSMEEQNIKPNEIIFPSTLKACTNILALRSGQILYDRILKTSFENDTKIASALVDMYAKCKCIEEAHKIFNITASINEVTWGSLIGGYAANGRGHYALQLFAQMQEENIKISRSVILSALKACADIQATESGRWIHNQIVRMRLEYDMDIASILVDLYAKCGCIYDANNIFRKMPKHDLVAWSAIIGGYASHGYDTSALLLFQQMEREETEPDKIILVSVLKAVSNSNTISLGRLLHHQAIRNEDESDVNLGSALVGMYTKCGSLDEGLSVFSKLQERDIVTWSMLIAGCVQHGYISTGFNLFKEMLKEGLMPNEATYLSLLRACQSMRLLDSGMMLHSLIVEDGFDTDVTMGSSLVDMYAKSTYMHDASCIFDTIPKKDVVTWSVMISGYIASDDGVGAIDLYQKMQQQGVRPDKVSCLSILKACAMIGGSDLGKLMHKEIIVSGFESDIDCSSAIVSMYAKCGCLNDAYKHLTTSSNPNVVAWGAMISAHASSGADNVELLIKCMEEKGVTPDDVIFLNMLAACSHVGLMEKGNEYLKSMMDKYFMIPKSKHYNCLIDLFGRAGKLNEAQDLMKCIPTTPDAIGHLSLLSGCKTYNDLELGLQCYKEVVAH